MGGALALALSKKKYPVAAIISRAKKSAGKLAGEIGLNSKAFSLSQINSAPDSELIFITTPDNEIAAIAEKLAGTKPAQANLPVVLHTSGSLSSDVLKPLRELGCAVGSMHPLASVSEARLGIKRFKNAYFCVEGDPKARKIAGRIVKDLGGKAFSLETKYKPLYHAAAVMTSGHTTALFATAVELLSKCGLAAEKAQAVLFPLLMGTAENLSRQTPSAALTGSFARADVGAFERHLKALVENAGADSLETYLLLGKISLKLVEEQGADKSEIKALRKKIDQKLNRK